MKNKIIDSIGKIDDDMIESVDALRQSKKKHSNKKNTWVKLGAMAACLCLVVAGAVTMFPKHYGTMTGDPITDLTENNSIPGAAHTENAITSNEAGGGSYVTAAHMIEIQVQVDVINSWGFIGTVETGAVTDTCTFSEGEQLSIVCEDNVTIVQKDGSIFDFDELEPNVDESDLEIGDSVWIGFQIYDYAEGNGMYNQVLAYHVNRTLADVPVDESN